MTAVDFTPAPPVAAALLACGLLPLVLLGVSRGPLRVAAPGRRFAWAAGITWGLWVVLAVTGGPDGGGMVTGALVLAAATLAGFTLWTLLAWGFTLSLVRAVGRVGTPAAAAIDAATDADCLTPETFTRDRLGVLLRFGLAEVRGGRVVLTPRWGWAAARLVTVLRTLFGLPL